MTTAGKDAQPAGGIGSFLRRLLGVDSAEHAEVTAHELSLERATAEATAGGLDILDVTWRAPLAPTAAGTVVHLLAYMLVGIVYGLVVWYAGPVFHTYHAVPHAKARRAVWRSRLVALAHAALFGTLVVSVIVAVLTGAYAAYCSCAGGGHVRDARAVAPVAFVAAGLVVVTYAGLVWLSFLKLPAMLRGTLRSPFRAAAVAVVPQTR